MHDRSHPWKVRRALTWFWRSLVFAVNHDSSLDVIKKQTLMLLPCCLTSCHHQPVWCSGEGSAPSPYGLSEPQQPLQAFTALESNWAECVGINYPIIQHRHAIKGAAAITRCRHHLSHVTVTQHGRRLLFFCPAEGGADARTETRQGRAHISCTLFPGWKKKTLQMI